MQFNTQAARAAGYTDEEIAAYLAQEQKFNLQGALQAGYSHGEVINFLLPAAAPPEKTGMLRAAADIPVQVGRGVAAGVKAFSDAFGSDNPVSRAASGVEGYLGELLSAQAQNNQAEISRIMKEAENKGVGSQVAAAAKAIATAPVDTISQVFGTAIPVIAGGLVGSLTRLGASAVGYGIGATMGAGTVKGSIYEAVKQELKANNIPEAEAERRAQEAQAYGGENIEQILLGAGLGAAASRGAERIITDLIKKGAMKPSALPAAARIPTAAVTEALPEAAQAAQERIAQNIALQREGYDVPTMRGVAGQAAFEGLAGAGLGAIAGAAQRTAPEAKITKEAKTPEGKVAGRTTVVTDEETAARLREEQAAEPQQAEAEAPKPVTGEAGIVRPEEEVKPLTMEEQRELELQQRLYRSQQPKAEDLLGEVRGQIQTAPPTTPADIARIRDDHETAVINALLEQDRKMQSVSDLARLNLERMSQTESLEAATKDADRRVREGRLMGRVQSLIDENIPFASTAIADINRKFEMIGESPLDDTERARVQNIMTMAQGFTDFVKLPSLPVREQDRFAENQAMEALIKERKPRGEVSPQPVRAEAPAPSPVVGQAPVSGRVEEGATIRPTVSPEPSIAEDRQRAEPVVEAAAPIKPVGAAGMGQRMVNAANRFRDSAVEQFGLTPEQADRAMGRLMKEKVLSLDPVTGQFKLKDGRFWDREVLLRAAGETASQTAPAQSAPIEAKRGAETRIIAGEEKIPAQWEVVEADSVKAAMTEGKTQPRDRQRAVSNAQIMSIAQNPDFDRLSDTSQTMDYGAPTLTQDGAIVGGNGRFEGVNLSYDTEAGQRYKQSLLENAERLGLDPEQIGAMQKPILVRRITQPADTRKLAIQSNIVAGLELSDMEQAALDAERMAGLDRLEISEAGDIPITSRNMDVLRSAFNDYTTEEMGKMMSAEGGLSQAGLRRVRNAILYKAYGKTDTLSRLVESPDPDLKNVGTALMRASGGMSKMMDAIRSGAIPAEYDIIEDLTGAIETLSSLRASGTKVQEFLAQSDMFGDGISGPARAILRFMDNNLRSAKSITEFLNDYAQAVLSAESAKGGLFEEVKLPTKQETLERAAQKYEAQRAAAKSQRTLEEQPAGEVRPEARVQPEGEGRAVGSDEEVKKPVSIKQEQTDKERQAQINRERQQAKRAAAEAERAEKERRKAEKEAEAKRKAEAAAERERAKRKAEEMEAKRKAEKEKSKREQDRRKAEEAEAKRKAEEAEAKRKAAELPPYEQRVKLSADDLYPQLKDFDSAVNAIYDRASNPAEKEIASLIKSRVAQFKELGFAFSLRVTPEGKMLSSRALGHSVIKYSPIGEATTISIALNHPSNGDQSGTRWDTVTHELLHAVTQAQIRFAPEGSAARQLKSLFNDVVDYFNERAKAKTLTAFESRMYNGEINALRNPDELLAWGLSDKNMQSWLNGIDSKKGNFLSRLYDIVANVLGFGKSNTALAELLSVSEALLTEPVDAYITKANLRGKSFGMQKNVSDIPGWALSFAEGLPVVWSESDAALIKAESITGKTIYLVATPEGISLGDVAGYTGNLLPPARLAEVKGIADTFRSEPKEEIRFMRSALSPTAAGQQALNTINQLGMGVKEPEKGTLEKAKAKLQQIGEAPAKDTIKDWKKKAADWMSYVDGKLFSADAPFENKLREGYRRDMKDMKEFIGAQLAISQSQAVNADAVSTRSMLIGKPRYRKDLLKWEAVEDPANEIAKAKILDKIAEKYGLTKEEAVQVAHTYLAAANYESILERNAANKESKDKVREKARKLDSEIVKLNAEYQKRIDEQREQAETEIAKLQGKIRELKSEGDRESEIADLKDRIGELRKEREPGKLITQLKKEIKALREEHAEQTKEIERLGAADVFVTPEQAAMVQPGLEIANQIPEVKEITALWNQQRENVINVLVETGLWTPKYADAMMDNAAYVPFNREMEEDSDDSPEIMIRGLQVKAKEHKLKGSSKPVANVFENMARWQQYAINRAIRNHKALQMVDAATEMPFGDGMMATKVSESKRGKNITRVWRDGKQEFYEMADPLFVDAFKSLGAVSIPSVKYFTAIANKLRQFIVLYPMFSVAQLSQDSVAAMFSSGLQPKFALKIPYLAVKHAISTFRGTNNLHNELINFGVVGVRDFNAAVSRDDAAITAGIKMPPGGLQKVKYVLERIAMSADNAVRQAVYEAAMQQPGVTQAEALEKAFEVINFRRRGSSKLVNLIGQTVPFFYAYLSAQRVAYKTITGVGISPVERKAAIETLIYTSAAVMALSFMYAMANGDDEAYEKTPGNIRDRSINIPGTNGFRIPLRPDFFLFPKIIAEHTYHLIAENGFSDPAKFKKAMADNFFNATLSPNVVPQAFKPAVEIGLNYDFFSGKPIVGFFEQNKEAGRQFNDSTSEFAKMMGGAGLSPQKVDHFIRGYFGTVGGLFLYGTNFFIEGESGVPRPELSFEDAIKTFPGVSALKQKPTENALKVDFYELRDAIEKAKNTYDDIKKRSPEGLQDFIENEENYAKLALEKSVTKIADHLSDIRRTIQQVSAAPEDRFSAAEKQERIKELKEVELQLLKSVNLKEMRAMAKM